MKTLITGATGLVGRRLIAQLKAPRALSRSVKAAAATLGADVDVLEWDPLRGPPPAEAFDGVEVVFHLAGEPVAEGRWTADKKRRIEQSRVLGTRHLVEGIASASSRPRVLVAASAVGFYGDRGDEQLDESSAAGAGFLSDVCRAWEAEAQAAEAAGLRVVVARLGVVLASGGGALSRMLTPFRAGVGGRLGSGKHYMPWVHVDDAAGLLLLAAQNDAVKGPLNVVSPTPVTNAVFTKALGRAVSRPAVLPMPALALWAVFGEVADVLLSSQRVRPLAAERAGYVFRYPDLDAALEACLTEERSL